MGKACERYGCTVSVKRFHMVDTETIESSQLALDQQSSPELVHRLIASQRDALDRLLIKVQQPLADAVDAAAQRLRSGRGRLVFLGAGASGRICVQDGAELWPTFAWPDERLLLLIAGGERALTQSIEGAEDDVEAAREQVTRYDIGAEDVVLGVAASGRSPWTVAWLAEARARGALSIAISANAHTPLLAAAEFGITLHSGAEVLAGSTRLAAGTAQKTALNAFSTALMVRLNRCYGNLMVDMAARNTKLDERRRRMVKAILPDADDENIDKALASAQGWVKLAVLLVYGDSEEAALARLERHAGSLRAALAERGEL